MSIQVNTDRKDYISGAIKGVKFNIGYVEETYDALMEISKSITLAETSSPTVEAFEIATQAHYDTAKMLVDVDYKATVAASNPFLHFNPQTEEYFLKIGTLVSKHALPAKFVEIIEGSVENKIDITPIINLCKRFLMNPFFTPTKFRMLADAVTTTFVDKVEVDRLMEEEDLSREVAVKRATYADKEITNEGYIRTYKVVEEHTMRWILELNDDGTPKIGADGKPIRRQVSRFSQDHSIDENTGEVTSKTNFGFLDDRLFKPAIWTTGDDFFCGDKIGQDYQIGKLHRLPSWENCDVKDNQKHDRGLHSGGLAYIECYRNHGELVDAFVCPSKVAKFTDDGTGEMTSLELYIHGSTHLEGTTKSMYNTSTYGAIQKKQWEEELIVAIKQANDLQDEAASDMKLSRATLSDLDMLSE